MNDRPPTCEGCPAHHRDALGWVPPVSVVNPDIVVVGQGPGEQEAEFSTPFYHRAPSGSMLRDWISQAEAAVGRHLKVSIGNVVQCWLPQVRLAGGLGKQSRPPTPEEMRCCWDRHTGPWLNAQSPTAPILAVGAPATQFLLGLEGPVEHLVGVTHYQELPTLGEPPQ